MRQKSFAAVIAGPSAIIRAGIRRILSSSEFRIVASASFVDEPLLSSLPNDDRLLLIIDVGIAPAASIEQMRFFKSRYPAGRIAVLGSTWRLDDVLLTYQAGASAYLTKVSASSVLLKSLELAMLGDTTILPSSILSLIHNGTTRYDPSAGESPADETHSTHDKIAAEPIRSQDGVAPQLSEREACVLRCLLMGNANKVIARTVNLTEAAVKVRVASILRKLRVHNRTHAAILAMRHHQLFARREDVSEGEPDLPPEDTVPTLKTPRRDGLRRRRVMC
jgi:two-component system, NarL family, nitrate/nitrite response regulator NarL